MPARVGLQLVCHWPRALRRLHDSLSGIATSLSMRGAKRSVRTGPRMDVTSINTSTALSIVSSSIRCPAPLRVSKATTAAARVAATFAKKNDKFKIIGATMGEQILDAAQTKTLASLPSLDQLRSKLIGLLLAPATKIAGVLQAPAGQLARVMAARGRQ